LKNRFWLFVFVAAIVVIGLIAVIANGVANTKEKIEQPAGICTVELRGEIGIKYIIKNNLNTGGGDMIIESLNLPYRFNVTKGDTIRLTAITEDDYIFNAWTFNDGTHHSRNPLTRTVNDKNFVITANTLYAPQPTPTPTQQVIE
jgi:hypothetical protein